MARILVVDDEKAQRLALSVMLERAGHEPLEAVGGEEAMRLCESDPPDVVITDLQMPGTHGLELISRLRDIEPRPAIIAVSGTGSDQLGVAEQVGADAALAKPVFADRLLAAVDQALTRDAAIPTFVVSDPPHSHLDLDAVSALIGLDVFQTRLKFNFPAPEVLAVSDRRRATQVAGRFKEAGVRLALVEGDEISAMPWPRPVSDFAFTGSGLTAMLSGRAVTVPYDTPGTVVVATVPVALRPKGKWANRPQAKVPAEVVGDSGLPLVETMEHMDNVDIYFMSDGALQRLSIVDQITDFSGLGDLRRDTLAESLEATLVECQRRFRRMLFDTRLEKLRPRSRFQPGDIQPNSRRRYSFGTPDLREVLESVSPELGQLTQFELGSRLGYLTSRGRPPSWRE